jgi:hypothetical protein
VRLRCISLRRPLVAGRERTEGGGNDDNRCHWNRNFQRLADARRRRLWGWKGGMVRARSRSMSTASARRPSWASRLDVRTGASICSKAGGWRHEEARICTKVPGRYRDNHRARAFPRSASISCSLQGAFSGYWTLGGRSEVEIPAWWGVGSVDIRPSDPPLPSRRRRWRPAASAATVPGCASATPCTRAGAPPSPACTPDRAWPHGMPAPGPRLSTARPPSPVVADQQAEFARLGATSAGLRPIAAAPWPRALRHRRILVRPGRVRASS